MDVVVRRDEDLPRAGVDCASQLFGHVRGDIVASSRVSDANCVRLLLTGSGQSRLRSSHDNILQKVAVPQMEQVQNVNAKAGGVAAVVLKSSIKRSNASVGSSASSIHTAYSLQRVLEPATSLLEPPGMSDLSPNDAEQRRVLGALLVVHI